jgi:hypothetical protein
MDAAGGLQAQGRMMDGDGRCRRVTGGLRAGGTEMKDGETCREQESALSRMKWEKEGMKTRTHVALLV